MSERPHSQVHQEALTAKVHCASTSLEVLIGPPLDSDLDTLARANNGKMAYYAYLYAVAMHRKERFPLVTFVPHNGELSQAFQGALDTIDETSEEVIRGALIATRRVDTDEHDYDRLLRMWERGVKHFDMRDRDITINGHVVAAVHHAPGVVKLTDTKNTNWVRMQEGLEVPLAQLDEIAANSDFFDSTKAIICGSIPYSVCCARLTDKIPDFHDQVRWLDELSQEATARAVQIRRQMGARLERT